MTRDDKINALRQVLQGTPIDKAFPHLHVSTMDTGDERCLIVTVGSEIHSVYREKVEDFINNLKEQNPCKRIDVSHISKEEYDRISAKLEEEY